MVGHYHISANRKVIASGPRPTNQLVDSFMGQDFSSILRADGQQQDNGMVIQWC
jgi:hypothetical protein